MTFLVIFVSPGRYACVSGYGGWHIGNQSQDEVFLAAQEAVGAHRDSQGKIYDPSHLVPLYPRAKSVAGRVS